MRLTLEEKETLINYDYFTKKVSIYTTEKAVRDRILKRLKDRLPDDYQFKDVSEAWDFEFDMSWCRKPDGILMLPHTPRDNYNLNKYWESKRNAESNTDSD